MKSAIVAARTERSQAAQPLRALRRLPMRPVAIFRFSPSEGPGRFGEWLDTSRARGSSIALDAASRCRTTLRAFAGIGMMGGPMSVNDDAAVGRAAVTRCCATPSTTDVR